MVGLRRDRFAPKQFSRNFAAGRTVTISGSDAVLVAERAPAPPPPAPAPAPRPDPVAPKAAPVRITSMEGFDSQEGWMLQDNGVSRHKGGGFLTYKLRLQWQCLRSRCTLVKGGGLFRGGKGALGHGLRRCQELHVLSELDDNNLTVRDFVNGKGSDARQV